MNRQKKAIILFAVFIFLFSIVLSVLAIREAEREWLIREAEINRERLRITEQIKIQVQTIIHESEGRTLIILQNLQDKSETKALREACRKIVESEDIIEEVFFMLKDGQAVFPLEKRLYLLPNRTPNLIEIPVDIRTSDLWKIAQAAEFRTQDYSLAVETYRELIESTPDRAARTILLHHLGRCCLKRGYYSQALEAYRQVNKHKDVEAAVDGIPLGVVALYQTAKVYEKLGRYQDAAAVYLDLYQDLLSPRWPLVERQYTYYRDKSKNAANSLITDDAKLERNVELTKRYDALKQTDERHSRKMHAVERLQERIIPLVNARMTEQSNGKERFTRFSRALGTDLFLVSYALIAENFVLGILFDDGKFAQKISSMDLNPYEMQDGWHVQIEDEFNNRIIAGDFTSPVENEPVLMLTSGFHEEFPPWKIKIFQKDPAAAERQFKFKRNIYLLTVAVVLSAVLFGGFMIMRGMAKELELAKLKENLVSSVSHELKTPLTSIRYLSELLHRGRVHEEAKKEQYYKVLTLESERLARLVDNILDYSKIEAGMKDYRFGAAQVADFVKDVLGRFRRYIEPRTALVNTEIAASLPLIKADKEALSCVFFNLLDNAVKYSDESPEIWIRARYEEGHVVIEVEDEGMGIAQDEQERVFETFYRSPRVRNLDIEGSGIGLTLASRIVQAHGGEIQLESSEGKGTTVMVKLPIYPESE